MKRHFSIGIQMADRHEKLLNITNHQGNANQNSNEIPPHTCQKGYYQKVNKQHVLVRMWRTGNPCALLVGLQIGGAPRENSMKIPQKTKLYIL